MNDFVENILSNIANVILFFKQAFTYGQITIIDRAQMSVGKSDYSHRRFIILVPVIAAGVRNVEIFEEQEEFVTLYFSNKISFVRNRELDFISLRLCILGFGFQYSSQFRLM